MMPMMPKTAQQRTARTGTPQVELRLGSLTTLVQERQRAGETVSSVVRRDLAPYYRLLADEAATLVLDENEWHVLARALADREADVISARYLWADVVEAAQDGRLPAEWDSAGLARKLAGLSPGAKLSVLDAVERRA
jgi:hypothetical protein